MRILTRRVAAMAIVSTLSLAGLAGCGGSDDSSDSSSSSSKSTKDTNDVAPATGDVISADGFSFNAPSGWTDAKDVYPNAVAVAADRQDTDGFAENVNVINDPSVVGADVDKIEDGIKGVLEKGGAKDVTIKDPIDVDGTEAARVSSINELNGTRYQTEQFAVDHDDKGYIITFSYSESVSESDRDQIAESVLKSWKWSS